MSLLQLTLVQLILACTNLALVVQRDKEIPTDENDFSTLRREIHVIKEWNGQKSVVAATFKGCPPVPAKRLAMLVSGVESRLLLASKLSKVVEPLAKQGISVDVYIDVLGSSFGIGEQWTSAKGQVESNDLQETRDTLSTFLEDHCGELRLLEVRDQKESIPIPSDVPQVYPGYPNETALNVFRRYSSHQFLMAAVGEQEMRRDIEYDFVLLTRDDDDWLGELKLADLTQDNMTEDFSNTMYSKICKNWGNINDQTLFFGRKAAGKVLSGMYPFMMEHLHDLGQISRHRGAEGTFKAFIDERAKVQVRQMPFGFIPATVAAYSKMQKSGNVEICHKRRYLCVKKEEGYPDLNVCDK